jgi:molybdopterin biosynthesis enzyme
LRPLLVDQVDAGLVGKVLTRDERGVPKGTVLTSEHVALLRGVPELHVGVLEPGDVHEDEAAVRLGRALAGAGVEARAPRQSQVRLLASRRGLFRTEPAVLEAINALGAISVFTLVDGQAVDAGEEVAGAKVTPVAVREEVLAEAEAIARAASPLVEVVGFRPLRTVVLATEKLKPKARALFRAAVEKKLSWYGARLLAVQEIPRAVEAVRAAYQEALAQGAELVLFAGASSIDPLEPAYLELREVGGEVLQQGAPMHPGSMLWLGRLGEAPVLGVASCAGFGRSTSLDLVLPFVFAYGIADPAHVRRLGHGGLIESAAGRRFPPYG